MDVAGMWEPLAGPGLAAAVAAAVGGLLVWKHRRAGTWLWWGGVLGWIAVAALPAVGVVLLMLFAAVVLLFLAGLGSLLGFDVEWSDFFLIEAEPIVAAVRWWLERFGPSGLVVLLSAVLHHRGRRATAPVSPVGPEAAMYPASVPLLVQAAARGAASTVARASGPSAAPPPPPPPARLPPPLPPGPRPPVGPRRSADPPVTDTTALPSPTGAGDG